MATQKFDPEKAENLGEIEKQFAVVAVEHAQAYWNLLEKVQPSTLRLTKIDDEIFEDLSRTFPELVSNPSQLEKLDEDIMKSAANKKRWREFIMPYEKKVTDYNFGTLIRTDSKEEYGEVNSLFVTRMQFFAIEIARNRLGLNNLVHEIAQKAAQRAPQTL